MQTGSLLRLPERRRLLPLLAIVALLAVEAAFGLGALRLPLRLALGAIAGGAVALIAIYSMEAGLTLFVLSAALVEFNFSTGTLSTINVAMLLAALLTVIWLLRMIVRRELYFGPRSVALPVIGFVAAGAVAWAASYAMPYPYVRLPDGIFRSQAGQFAVWGLSAAIFLIAATTPLRERTIKLWTGYIILVGTGIIAIEFFFRIYRPSSGWTGGLFVWPFVLLAAQFLFNSQLSRPARIAGLAIMVLWVGWVLRISLSWKSSWVPTVIASGLLLTWRRAWKLLTLLALVAIVFTVLAGQATISSELLAREEYSAGPVRWTIWLDVFRLGGQAPIFGLGPANYFWHWSDPRFESLSYRFVNPWAFARSSYSPPAHNLYADLFAQIGGVGLFFFLWTAVAIVIAGWRAAHRPLPPFLHAFAYGVLAGFCALLVTSFFFAEWLMPFVYNLGLIGFRHSSYAWLLAGALVGLHRYAPTPEQDKT